MILTAIIFAAALAADIVTKHVAAAYLAGREAVTVIPRVVEFTYVENRGAAFGMLAGQRWIFLVLSTVAIAAIAVFIVVRKPQSVLLRVSLALIAAGGVGNMIERVADGFVTDFINFTFVKFYVFNVADSCVTVGCAALIVWMIADTLREKKKAAAPTSPDGGESRDLTAGSPAAANGAQNGGESARGADGAADEERGGGDE